MRVTPEGQAGVGDVLRTPMGEYLEVVWVHGAGDVSESLCEQSIAEFKGTPHFTRDSIAGRCCLFGDTSGRDTERIRRWKLKVSKGAA